MNDVLRIAHLRIAHQGAILRWAILTFTASKHGERQLHHLGNLGEAGTESGVGLLQDIKST